MTVLFHGMLADHYASLLQTATDPAQRSVLRAGLRYHEKQYANLKKYTSRPNLLHPVQGNYLRDVQEKSLRISS